MKVLETFDKWMVRDKISRKAIATVVALFGVALLIVPVHAETSATGVFSASLHKGVYTYKVDILNTSPAGYNLNDLLINAQYNVPFNAFPPFSNINVVKSPNPRFTCIAAGPPYGFVECTSQTVSAELPPGVTAHIIFTSTTPPPSTIPYGVNFHFDGVSGFNFNGFATAK